MQFSLGLELTEVFSDAIHVVEDVGEEVLEEVAKLRSLLCVLSQLLLKHVGALQYKLVVLMDLLDFIKALDQVINILLQTVALLLEGLVFTDELQVAVCRVIQEFDWVRLHA